MGNQTSEDLIGEPHGNEPADVECAFCLDLATQVQHRTLWRESALHARQVGTTESYALYGEVEARDEGAKRWGLLRDSDSTVGSTTGVAQPNFAVAFELDVP